MVIRPNGPSRSGAALQVTARRARESGLAPHGETIIRGSVADRVGPNSSATIEGPLLLADISGYTSFVATTELEHSEIAIAALLESLIASLRGRLEACQVAGDAVFFVGDGLDPAFLGWIEDAYVAFHRTVRELTARTTCGCRACALVPSLTMKAIAHYGRCSRRRIGTSDQVHGIDVILPHRLAKNGVPSREYVLVTAALADRLPDAERSRFRWREEDGGEFGAVRVGYYDLGSLRSRV